MKEGDVEGKIRFKRSLVKCKDRCTINLPKFVRKMGDECWVTIDTIEKRIIIEF